MIALRRDSGDVLRHNPSRCACSPTAQTISTAARRSEGRAAREHAWHLAVLGFTGFTTFQQACRVRHRENASRAQLRKWDDRRPVSCARFLHLSQGARSAGFHRLAEVPMGQALDVHRFHFAFTITFHYLFPQLTMGLALLLVYLKTKALATGDEHYNRAARFWARIFGINFALGVVTGIPMEFQFGTNWAAFSKAAGGVIGQTLAMEGVFSFFLESSFLGLFLFGEKSLGRVGHWCSAFLVFLGSWLSGFFIVATDAWMQHPTGYVLGPHGEMELSSFWGLLLNKWALWQYAHNMLGAVQTGCFVMAAVGAFYLLTKRDENYGRTFVRTGVLVGTIAALLQLFPTGDMQGKMIAYSQPATLAAMEGLFESQQGAPLAILGQPDVEKRRLDNPLEVPNVLSFLTYRE